MTRADRIGAITLRPSDSSEAEISVLVLAIAEEPNVMALEVKKAGRQVIGVSPHHAGRIAGASRTTDSKQGFAYRFVITGERFLG